MRVEAMDQPSTPVAASIVRWVSMQAIFPSTAKTSAAIRSHALAMKMAASGSAMSAAEAVPVIALATEPGPDHERVAEIEAVYWHYIQVRPFSQLRPGFYYHGIVTGNLHAAHLIARSFCSQHHMYHR